MPELDFHVEDAAAVPYAETPLLNFRLRVANQTAAEPVHSIRLRCQIMIEAPRRRYRADEQARLRDLFGEPELWQRSLKSTLWTNTNIIVPPFTGSTVADLPVPCTFDFNVAATKYFAALDSGEVPLLLLFSGTVFYEASNGLLQVTQIPWEKEAHYRLPVIIWQEMMEKYYPNSAWLCLRRDAFDRLYRYKLRRGLPTFEAALESLLPADEEPLPADGGEMIH
ncbi:MAG TPA: DUF6084 family protein [Blastocatellia bacterium]|nr:DUF6084 family protein [Blastocatellia bacterium]